MDWRNFSRITTDAKFDWNENLLLKICFLTKLQKKIHFYWGLKICGYAPPPQVALTPLTQ
jgi:hypothetical protein